MTMALLVAGCQESDPSAARVEQHTFTSEAGARHYRLYVPASAGLGARPLLVDLHGCTSNPEEEMRWSRFNELAATLGMLVAYPEQDPAANGSRCWNWFHPDQQARDSVEPALIAGITREVMARFRVDPRRVYVSGISAGGAMANIMAVTHPDLYAAAMVYAGCEYRGETCFGSVAALPPEVSGQLAYEAMGPRARAVPFIVIQGDQDPLVPYPNADLVVQQVLAMADWADDGANDGSVPREVAATRTGTKPGSGRSYEVDSYRDAAGCLLAERWLLHGTGHQWSNAPSDGSPRETVLIDPDGPDVSGPTLDFLLSHPYPVTGVACNEE